MRHKPASGGPAHQWAQRGHLLDGAVFLKVTERSGRLGPTIKTERRFAQSWHGLKQRFIQCHIEIGWAWTGSKEIPGMTTHGERARNGKRASDYTFKASRLSVTPILG